MVIQEWERCYYLATVRHLTQEGRARGPAVTISIPCCLARLIPGMKESTELKEVARYVVEDMKEDLFRELMGYMPECRQVKSTKQQLEIQSSPPTPAEPLREPPVIPNSIIRYSDVHLRARMKRKLPTLAPERSGPSLSCKEYRAPIVTPAVDHQRHPIMTVRKASNHPADNTPPQYSRIRFAEHDTIATFGPRWGHSNDNGCCSRGRHICHNTDTWLSRNELKALHYQRSIDLELYGRDSGDV